MSTGARECRDVRCRAPIFMLKNERTGVWGPIDMEAVPGGNITVDLEAGTYRVVPKQERGDRKLHKSHFATCPYARRFR